MFTSLTLHRTGVAAYQVTLWADGVARWDGEAGVSRAGTWQARFPVGWVKHLAPHVDALPARVRPAKGDAPTVTLVVEKYDGTTASIAVDLLHCKRTPVWTLVTLIEGVTAQLAWTSADDGSVRVHLRQRRCHGVGRWYPDGRLVVEVGSRASSAEAPSLTGGYRRSRQRLIEEGVLVLSDSGLFFTREHVFGSASHAATVLTGHNTSGPNAWFSDDGCRLRQFMESAQTSESPPPQ